MIRTEKESSYFKPKTSLEDLIDYDLKVLFVGGSPTVATLKAGRHFANETNPFWECLSESGLIDDRLRSYQEKKLPKNYRLGIVTLNTNEVNLTMTEIANNKSKLTKMIQTYCPRVVCFVGKDIFESYSAFDCTEFGLQSTTIVWPHKNGETRVFIIPKLKTKVEGIHDTVTNLTYFDELNHLAELQDKKYPKD